MINKFLLSLLLTAHLVLCLAKRHPPKPLTLAQEYNCSLTLAYRPKCGVFFPSSESPPNLNHGISLRQIKNIIAFGDSWTAMDDSIGMYPPPTPVILGTDPMAGGRASNGPTWTEYMANDLKSPVHPYAVGGAVSNLTLWPSAQTRPNRTITSFIDQTDIFISQHVKFHPQSTLFTVFFGINDYMYSKTDGTALLQDAAKSIDNEVRRLIHAGARNILTVGVYFDGPGMAEYERTKFKNTERYREEFGINVAYATLLPLWNAISERPKSFGYTSLDACLPDPTTTLGACDSSNTHIYWQDGHPCTCTHRIIADYIEDVLELC